MKLKTSAKFCLVILFAIILHAIVTVQPGNFPRSFESYDKCNAGYFKADFVFVGNIKFFLPQTSPESNDLGRSFNYEVEVKQEIKGELQNSVLFNGLLANREDLLPIFIAYK